MVGRAAGGIRAVDMRWTGHALVDVGIAGVCAFRGRSRPEDITDDDLDAVAAYMEEEYYSGKLLSYLSCVFMNSSFVQPNESPAKRAEFVARYLRAHRAPPDPEVLGLRCAFSGEPATARLVRTHLPLFSGEDVLNFRPGGQTFVPAAGRYVTALMFLPMASRRCEGRLLAVHADQPNLTIAFARRYLEDNRRLLALALPASRQPSDLVPGCDREIPMWDTGKKRYKYADAKGPQSLVVHDLTQVAAAAAPTDVRPHPVALTVYLLSNSGQGPSLEIFDVPSGLVSFVRRASAAGTREAWEAIASRFRPLREKEEDSVSPEPRGRTRRKKPAGPPPAGRPGWTRNPAFDELCGIFTPGFTDRAAAAKWLRAHILGRIERGAGDVQYDRTRARSWALAALFLEEVLGMKSGRIETIRAFADKLATWIQANHDNKLFRAVVFDRRLSDVRQALLQAQRESAKKNDLLFGLDEYRNVWLHEDGDEYLVRDLICVRLVERLHELGYFGQHPEEVIDGTPAEQADAEEEAKP